MNKLLFIVLIITSIVSTASADMGTCDVHEIKIAGKTYFWRDMMSVQVKNDYCVYDRENEYLSEFENYIKLHKKEIYQSFVSILSYKLNRNHTSEQDDARTYSVINKIKISKVTNLELIRSYSNIPITCEHIVNLNTTDQLWVDEKDLEYFHSAGIESGDLWFYSIRNTLETEKIRSLIDKIENLAKYNYTDNISKLKKRKVLYEELRKNFVVLILHQEGC